MVRSPLTLAAAVTAAVPGAEVVAARALTANSDGRFDSAIATLSDGSDVAIRVATDDDGSRELAAEALALRSLTNGARAIMPFAAPEYRGEARLGDAAALVTTLLPGYQVEAANIPAGPGAAASMGEAIAAIHALPSSVIRSAGLVARTAAEVREDVEELVDASAATGRVPARLTVRWRAAVADDTLWQFESAVVLAGTDATSFLFTDDAERGPQVTGVVHWHGLSLGDPAADLAWVASARAAADDIHAAYAAASERVTDNALAVRARLYAELEFARWLVHGDELRRDDIVNDAARLLESLAEGLRSEDLRVIAERDGIDSALDAVNRMPETVPPTADTSMQTDTYNPEEFALAPDDDDDTHDISEVADPAASTEAEAAPAEMSAPAILPRARTAESAATPPARTVPTAHYVDQETAPLDPLWSDDDELAGSAPADSAPMPDAAADLPADEETQRAARAALHRWTSSASE